MRWPSQNPRHAIRRAFLALLYAQIATILGLMTYSGLRKRLRGVVKKGFPVTPPASVAIGATEATTYTYGADLYADMLAAIGTARKRILLETYIWKSDTLGKEFKHALIEAAERGVDVHIIYDGFANLVVPPSFFRFPSPVQVLRYPVFAASWRFFDLRQAGREHRKLLVVDGHIAFVGGYNLGATYATQWRDTHVRLTGPSAWDLDNAFVDFWNVRCKRSGHPMLKDVGSSTWESRIRLHRNVPRQMVFPIRGMYLEAIDRAQLQILITQAYFIPDSAFRRALIQAARRGVDVCILMPRASNHVVADWLARGMFDELLAAKVRIFRYRHAMVHAKTATIDGKWTTVGTANIDRLSLTGNYEVNLEIFDDDMAAQMGKIFARDRSNADELDPAQWSRRSVVERFCERILAPLRPLL